MIRGFLVPGPRRRNVLIAALGVVVIAVGSGVGIYVYSRAHRPVQQPAARNGAAPTPAPVGAQTVDDSQQAVLLSVVSTNPVDGNTGIAPNTSITLRLPLAPFRQEIRPTRSCSSLRPSSISEHR